MVRSVVRGEIRQKMQDLYRRVCKCIHTGDTSTRMDERGDARQRD